MKRLACVLLTLALLLSVFPAGVAEEETAGEIVLEAPSGEECVEAPEEEIEVVSAPLEAPVEEEPEDALAAQSAVREYRLVKDARVSLNIGDQLQIVLDGQAVSAAKSDKGKVALVTAGGLVKAQAEGKAKITVQAGEKKKLKLTVTVVDPYKPESVSFAKSAITMNVGDSLTLEPRLKPDTARTAYTWKSAKSKVASVSAKGEVKALAEGTAKITVTTANKKKAEVTVTVVDPYKPGSVSFAKKSVSMKAGDKLTLEPKLQPAAARTVFTWKSSKAKVAEVKDGVVTAKAAGKAKITVTTANKKKATVEIIVTASSDTGPAIAAQPKDLRLKEGKSGTFTVRATGSGLKYQWQLLIDDFPVWDNIEGATKPGYTVKASAANNLTQYRCVVTDEKGRSVSSDTVSLVVEPKTPLKSLKIQPVPVAFDRQRTYVKVKFGPKNASFATLIFPEYGCDPKTGERIYTTNGWYLEDETTAVFELVINDYGSAAFAIADAYNTKLSDSVTIQSKKFVSPISKFRPSENRYKLTNGSVREMIVYYEPWNATTEFFEITPMENDYFKVCDYNASSGNLVLMIIGKKVGSSSITIKAKDDNGKSITLPIEVEFIPFKTLKIKENYEAPMGVGETRLYTCEYTPEVVSRNSIHYSGEDSDDNVYDENGTLIYRVIDVDIVGDDYLIRRYTIQAVNPGTAKFRLETGDGSNLKATRTVNVVADKVYVDSMFFDTENSAVSMIEGDQKRVVLTVSPANATYSEIEWEMNREYGRARKFDCELEKEWTDDSGRHYQFKISADGPVTGKLYVRAKDGSRKSADCWIYVHGVPEESIPEDEGIDE